MYGWDILHVISKDTFGIPHKISYPCIERYDFLFSDDNLRALRFTSSYAFLNSNEWMLQCDLLSNWRFHVVTLCGLQFIPFCFNAIIFSWCKSPIITWKFIKSAIKPDFAQSSCCSYVACHSLQTMNCYHENSWFLVVRSLIFFSVTTCLSVPQGLLFLHFYWVAPVEICVIMGLLYREVGWAFVPGLGLIILLLPIQLRLGKTFGYLRYAPSTRWYEIQSSAIITRPNIVSYCITGCRNSGRIEYQSDAGSTKDAPCLALTGERWGVFCEYFWELTAL